jgi:hypothetical protein
MKTHQAIDSRSLAMARAIVKKSILSNKERWQIYRKFQKHDTFGCYAHGLEPETAVLPRHWKDRLVVISNANTRGVRGYCLHPVAVAASKSAAGRERDIEYVRVLKKKKLIQDEKTRSIVQRELPAEAAQRITTLLESL